MTQREDHVDANLLTRLERLEGRVLRLRLVLALVLILGGSTALLGSTLDQSREVQTRRLVLLDDAGNAAGELVANEGKLLMRVIPRDGEAARSNTPAAVAGIMLSRENGFVVVGENGKVIAKLGGDPWRWLPGQ